MSYCENFIKSWGSTFYVISRVLVGLLFFMHGGVKVGLIGGSAMSGLMLFVGFAELLVGLALVLGFFTRLASGIGAIIMLVAYFKVHFPEGLNPLSNGGELALIYLAAFLVFKVYGAVAFSLEKYLFNKEYF